MEQIKWVTPNKGQRCDIPLRNKTPIKQNENRSKHTAYQNNAGYFTVLPSHITPPSELKEFIRRNPFEVDLTDRLHLSMISPTIFAKVSSSAQQSPGFTWSIDELALIQPAKIEEFPIQQVHSPDPEMELKAQAAIDRFFNQNEIIPSPWEIRQKENKVNIDLNTPNRLLDDLNSTKELSKLKKDAWSQTVLSLPLDLPQNVEEALKPFFTFTQEQNVDSDDVNSSNNSLRRKLFFNHDECIDNDNESFISLSPVKMDGSMILSCSPPQSGIFMHGTPLKKSLQTVQRNEQSFIKSRNLSPPNMSPIQENKNDILYKAGHCSVTQLSFTTNISTGNIEKNHNSDNDHLLDILFDTSDVKSTKKDHKLKMLNNHKRNLHELVNIEVSKSAVAVDDTIHSDVIFDDKNHNGTSLNILTEVPKNLTYESHKQSNTVSSTFDVESISNSAQDTGYQTYSMNGTMHTMDSYNNISINHKIHWNERITFKDDQLFSRENMRNVFSSTPSKCNKEKEN